jgi:hypothetical protein
MAAKIKPRTLKVKFYVAYNRNGNGYDVYKTYKAMDESDYTDYTICAFDLKILDEDEPKHIGSIEVR